MILLPATSVVDPPTTQAPVCNSEAAVRFKSPVSVKAARLRGVLSFNVRFLKFPGTATVPENVSAESSRIECAPSTASVVFPATLMAPLSVMSPPAVTVRFPDTVEAPRSIAFASVSATSLPETTFAVVKSFAALFSVTSFTAPASKLAVLPAPFTLSAPDCVIAPFAFTVRLPETVDAPRSIPFASVSATSLPETTFAVVKSLPALFSVMLLPAPASKLAVLPAPFTLSAPDCVITPLAFTVRSPETVETPKSIPVASVSATLLPAAIATVPKLLSELFNAMLLPAPVAFRVVRPVTARLPAPLSTIPPDVVVRFIAPPTVEAPAPLKSITPFAVRFRFPPEPATTVPTIMPPAAATVIDPLAVSAAVSVTAPTPIDVTKIFPATVDVRSKLVALTSMSSSPTPPIWPPAVSVTAVP